MSKQKAAEYPSMVQQLFQTGVYKGRQGRVTRQATWAAIAIVVVLSAYKLYYLLEAQKVSAGVYFGVPLGLIAVGLWMAYRVVNWPRFADFLIAVEAEMKKVSWPSWGELVRSSIVVIVVIFALAIILWGYDFLWQGVFSFLGIIN